MKHQFQLNNRVAVIDIGSNSVRLMMTENGKKLYKLVEITRLSLGMSEDGRISDTSAERTVTAVLHFYEKAKADGADKIYAFATACCRNASNGNEFVDKIYSLCGLRVEIIDGETEAKIGFLGACGNSGGVIDIGGASTEIIVKTDGETKYAKSVNIGVVRLFEWANNDRLKTELKVKEQIAELRNKCQGIVIFLQSAGRQLRWQACYKNFRRIIPIKFTVTYSPKVRLLR